MSLFPARIPTFLVIGGQKCGTTSLYNYLVSHPQACMSREKEVHYFDRELDYPDHRWYEQQFTVDPSQHLVVGEITPVYCVWGGALERIRAYNPEMRLVMLMRDPVHRAISQYWMEYKRGDESLSIETALCREVNHTLMGSFALRHHNYLARGRYIEQLERASSLFPREQILCIKFEALLQYSESVLKMLSDFINLPYNPDLVLPHSFKQEYPSTPIHIISFLRNYFAPFNAQLAAHYNVDISDWY